MLRFLDGETEWNVVVFVTEVYKNIILLGIFFLTIRFA